MSEFKDFTSLPPDKERHFVVYEKRAVMAGKKARMLGIAISAVFGVFAIIVVFSFPPPKNKMADDDMGMLQRATPKQQDIQPANSGETPQQASPSPPTEAPAASGSVGDPAPDTAAPDQQPSDTSDSPGAAQ